MRKRLRGEQGFGLLELIMAMTMLNIGILAIVAAFQSGAVAIKRASQVSTASALADSQLELYRALKYCAIFLDSTQLTTANGVTTYKSDTAWSSSQVTDTDTSSCVANATTASKSPSQTLIGPDHQSYRIDTYVVYDTPTNGRQLKKVTVVVRPTVNPISSIAREASTFDQSTGGP